MASPAPCRRVLCQPSSLMEPANPYQAWPKAELHLHLEGSVDPQTILELDPAIPPDTLRDIYRFHDFQGFIQAYKAVVERLRTPADYARIMRRLLARLAADNVQY